MMQAEFEHVIHQKSVEGGLHDKTIYTPSTQYNSYSLIRPINWPIFVLERNTQYKKRPMYWSTRLSLQT